jgi:hypothetical protein
MNGRHSWLALCAALFLLLGSPGCLEQKVKTTVSADGSCERTITVSADSGRVPDTKLPLPVDTTWTVRWEREDSVKKGFTWIASKKYTSLTMLAEDTTLLIQPGKIRITIQADRSFRWFYTYIHYRETYHRFATVDRVPPSAVMTEDEIRRFTAGEKSDTLKRKVEEWQNRNIADLFFCTLDTLLQGGVSPPVSAGMLQAHREDLFRNLSSKKEIDESLSEYLPSVKKKDFFQDSTFVMTAKGLEAMRRLFVKSLGTESARQLPLNEAWTKTMVFFYQAVEKDEGGDFENVVTLPGLFLDTNAGEVKGNTATWSFKRPGQLELMDYEMHAESRVVNTWAFIVSGVVAVCFLILLLIPLFRLKRSC